MKRTPLKRGTYQLKRTPFKRKTALIRPKTKRTGVPRLKSISQLKKVADAVFSVWIRTRDNGTCFTCGITKPIKEMQNGHYVSRGHNSLRFDERNCHCQCVGCNVFKHGNMDEYTLALTRMYGIGILDELSNEKRKIKQFTREELQGIIDKYGL